MGYDEFSPPYQHLGAPSRSAHPLQTVKKLLTFAFGITLICAAFSVEASGLHIARPIQRPANLDALSSANTTPRPEEDHCLPPLHTSLFGVQLPNRSHYCVRGGSLVFEPVPGCVLPPPQPYWFLCTLTSVKGLGIYLVLKTTIKEHYTSFEKNKAHYMAVFAVVITCVSCVLLIHKAWGMETESKWQHFECLGMMTSAAPWTSNILLMIVFSEIVEDGPNISQQKDKVPGEAFALLTNKDKSTERCCYASIFALFVFLGPFIVTNIVPASVIFGAAVPFYAGGFLFFRLMKALNGRSFEERLNLGPLVAIPGAIMCGMTMQWTGAVSTYFYLQFPYTVAFMVACSERRSDLYLENMYSAVLTHATYLSEIVNEAFP